MAGEEPRKRPRFRSGPTMGPTHSVGVAISFGFPIFVVGASLLITAYVSGGALFWIAGAALTALGGVLLTSSRTL
jgi:hypothetical protein